MPGKIIFTDLDGTLLDHTTYSYKPALPALQKIRELRVPLVFCSSKTAAELEKLRRELNLTDPFISENGGGIHFPKDGKVTVLGMPYEQLQVQLREISESLSLEFHSLKEMSVAETMALTGLCESGALLAQKRSFDLAFVVRGAFDLAVLEKKARERGLQLSRGARFLHLTGDNDKGRAVRSLVEHYEEEMRQKVKTIGLGDSENDVPMLEEVDIAVIIPNPGSEAPLRMDARNLIRATSPGPAGWNKAVLSLLSD